MKRYKIIIRKLIALIAMLAVVALLMHTASFSTQDIQVVCWPTGIITAILIFADLI